MTDQTVPIEPTTEALNARNAAVGAPATATGAYTPGSGSNAAVPSVENQGKPGYDVFGNAVSGTPLATGGAASTSPVAGAVPSPSDYYSRVGNEPAPFVAKSQDQIQQEKEADAKSLIDAVNAQYDTELNDQKVINEGRARGTNAVSVLAGLSGSSEANVAADKTAGANQNELNKINAQRGVAIQGILGNISAAAATEAQQQRQEARQSADDIQAYRTKAATDAVTHLTQLAQTGSGATIDGLKSTLPANEYDYLVKNAGGEDAVKAILFNSRPKSTVLGTPQVMGNQIVQAYTAPDGSVKYENVSLPTGVNPAGIQSVEKTDKGVFIINKDGTWNTIPNSGANVAAPKNTTPTIPTPALIAAAEQKLNASRTTGPEADGKYADPNLYYSAYQDWINKGYGTTAQFISKFPPKDYINPKNTFLPAYLMPPTAVIKAAAKADTTPSIDDVANPFADQ